MLPGIVSRNQLTHGGLAGSGDIIINAFVVRGLQGQFVGESIGQVEVIVFRTLPVLAFAGHVVDGAPLGVFVGQTHLAGLEAAAVLLLAVVADGCLHEVLFLLLGDDVDDAAGSLAAVQDGAASPDDLDPLHVLNGNIVQVVGAADVDRDTVDQYQGTVAVTPHDDFVGHVAHGGTAGAVLMDFQTNPVLEGFEHVGSAGSLKPGLVVNIGGRGSVQVLFVIAVGGDHDAGQGKGGQR